MKLFILVGIPGCGKTTYAKTLRHPKLRVVSTDQIREIMVQQGILGDINDMSANKEVFARFHDAVDYDLKAGFDCVADATNLRDFARARLCDIVQAHDAETHVIVFNNLGEAVSRNMKRDRVVPAEAMGNMLEQHEKALRDIPQETYTSVVYIESLA
jgi:predicted kinase